MGTNSSKDEYSGESIPFNTQAPKLRAYRPPDVRQKDRFEALDKSNALQLFDASIDKRLHKKSVASTSSTATEPRISWRKITNIWRQCIPGPDEKKRIAVDALAYFWQNRVFTRPEPSDELHLTAFVTIAREAIIDQLSQKSGLQLKISSSPGYLYCRIRAPIKLLEQQAKKDRYRLQFKGEIDPGSEEFWNRENKGENGEMVSLEIEEEKKILTKDEANVILERLYRTDKISPNDLGVLKEKETRETWSRRVHALERIADNVPVWNRFPAYAPFSSQPHLRYLFQTYPSVRGKTLFTGKDRLYLTKSIIENHFDLEVLVSERIVDSFMALHDANRGERLSLDILKKRWVTFWTVPSHEVGAPLVTDAAAEEGVPVGWYLRPFSQPLSDVRDYFGEKEALFYAWFGCYTYTLMYMAAVGLALTIFYAVHGDRSDTMSMQLLMLVFLCFVMSWTAYGTETWEREENAITLKWGTKGFVEDELNRPRYRADPAEPFRRSVVTNRMEVYFPEHKRQLMQVMSFTLICCLIALTSIAIFAIFYLEKVLYQFFDSVWITYFTCFLSAIQIPINSWFSKAIMNNLNEWENHRTQTDFENNLIFKTFQFELVNHYGAPIFIAFAKGVFDRCHVGNYCLNDLRVVLFFIVLIRFIGLFYELVQIFLNMWSSSDDLGDHEENPMHGKSVNDEEAELLSSADSDRYFIAEIRKSEPDSTLFKFARIVLQYGYLTLFVIAFPVLGVLVLVENLVQIRVDAWKLCTIYRRKHVEIAENVGYWRSLMSSMGYLAIVCNVGIVCFTTNTFAKYDVPTRWLTFLIIQQILVLVKYFVHRCVDTNPQELQDIYLRQKYIVDKFMGGLEDNDDSDVYVMNVKGNLDDADDAEGINKEGQSGALKGINKQDAREGEKNYSDLEELETQRRNLLRDLKLIKEQLQAVSKTEVYNPQTGIGETKHGLPLGRLTVRLVEMQNLVEEVKDPKMVVKVKVHIQGYRRDTKNLITSKGEFLLSQTASYSLSSAVIPFNQSLGPFAPINTLDADVVFDVIDTSPDSNEAVVASAAVKLRDLTDQQQHDKVLHLKTRSATGELELSKTSKAKLFVQLCFMYSNIVPLKTRIYHVQDKLRKIDKDVQNLRSGI